MIRPFTELRVDQFVEMISRTRLFRTVAFVLLSPAAALALLGCMLLLGFVAAWCLIADRDARV